jgi:hypothetical protein
MTMPAPSHSKFVLSDIVIYHYQMLSSERGASPLTNYNIRQSSQRLKSTKLKLSCGLYLVDASTCIALQFVKTICNCL